MTLPVGRGQSESAADKWFGKHMTLPEVRGRVSVSVRVRVRVRARRKVYDSPAQILIKATPL